MANDLELHKRLIARQPEHELKRKAEKACMHRGKLWTQEELDHADRKADRWSRFFNQQQGKTDEISST